MVPGLTIASLLVSCGTAVCRAWRAQIQHDGRFGARRRRKPHRCPWRNVNSKALPQGRASYKATFCFNHISSLLRSPWTAEAAKKAPHAEREQRTKSKAGVWRKCRTIQL